MGISSSNVVGVFESYGQFGSIRLRKIRCEFTEKGRKGREFMLRSHYLLAPPFPTKNKNKTGTDSQWSMRTDYLIKPRSECKKTGQDAEIQ